MNIVCQQIVENKKNFRVLPVARLEACPPSRMITRGRHGSCRASRRKIRRHNETSARTQRRDQLPNRLDQSQPLDIGTLSPANWPPCKQPHATNMQIIRDKCLTQGWMAPISHRYSDYPKFHQNMHLLNFKQIVLSFIKIMQSPRQ